MVLAFSLQSDVKSIGAYAGFAAIIGLALLVLLYFAQAREVRRMSDWLEQQEERLRSLPARSPVPRAVPVAPAGRVVATPAAVVAPEPGAAPTATVAVPGVRRVAVGPAGAVTPAAPVAAGQPAPGGVVAAATVAGAMAQQAAAGTPPPASETPEETDDTVPPGRVRVPGAAIQADADPAPQAEPPQGASPAQPGGGSVASAAVPLIARPAASAEPLGAAQTLDGDRGGSSSSPGTAAPAPGGGPAEPEAVAVATLEPGEGVVARPAPAPPGSEIADAEAPFASDGAVEISAERVTPSVEGAAPEQPASGGDLQGIAGSPAGGDEELPALAPSTPAGARPRFPPAPVSRAAPVGAPVLAAAGAGAAGGGAAALATDVAPTTRRRERPAGEGREEGEDSHRHDRGSLLRLLAAAVVIVLVLVFIATKVFAPAKVTGLIPSKVVVAVLNGTHVTGLAGQAAAKLGAGGFTRAGVANALSQGHHVTLVGYTPGNQAAAKLVAKDLAPVPTRVGPVDSRTATLADSLSATAPTVIVTVGSDYSPQ